MEDKDTQFFSTTLAVESAKKTAELAKEVASDVVRPTSKNIGDNIGKLVEGVFGWLGVWGEKQKLKQQQSLENFKEKISLNIEQIPEDNLKEPTMYIVGPAIEASKYYYEEDYFREMFAKLIAGACDNRLSNKVSPYFVEAIKQMTSQDALILISFKNNSSQPIVHYKYKLKNKKGEVDCFNYVFYSAPGETPETNSASIVNLERLGFISIDFFNHLVDESTYQKYMDDSVYIAIKQTINTNYNKSDYPYEDIVIKKGIVKLTPLGKNFISICL